MNENCLGLGTGIEVNIPSLLPIGWHWIRLRWAKDTQIPLERHFGILSTLPNTYFGRHTANGLLNRTTY